MSQAEFDSQNTTASEEAYAPAFESIPDNQSNNHQIDNTDGNGSGNGVQEQGGQSIEEAIAKVNTPEDFEAMMAEVQRNPNAFAKKEGQVVVQANAASNTVPKADSNQNVDSNDEDTNDDEGKKYPQFRLRPTDEVDAEAMHIKKAADLAHSPISLADAIEIAKRKLGIQNEPQKLQAADTHRAEPAEAGADYTEGLTLAEVKQEIKDLRKQHTQALRDGDLDEAADAMDKLTDAEELLVVVSEKETVRDQTQHQQHDTAFQASASRATELFPDFEKPDSAFYVRCMEIDEALRVTEDPRYFEADKPLLVARMAARELNLAPQGNRQSKPAQTIIATPQRATSTPTTQLPRTEKLGQLPAASGTSRTGTASGGTVTLVDQVAKIKGTEEFERLARQVHAAR